ncbi:MAG: hypothetical protein J0L86_03990 [Flavobacteriales bacterium]|nr:hypothetical protein [Flavobacteriales bacterium]
MNIKIKSILKNKLLIFGLIIALFGAYLHLPKYFEAYFAPLAILSFDELWISLDSSWLIALNHANVNNLTWGTDIAFTYGPLSYLTTRVGWGVNKIDFILYDAFVFLNFFLVYFLSIKNSKNKWVTILLVIGNCLLIQIYIGATHSLILLAFLVFWIRLSLDKPKWIYYVFQIVIVVLLFFIKFNTGLIALPLFLAGLFCNGFYKKEKYYLLLFYTIIPFLLIYTLCKILNVQLLPYVQSALEIISGYNDVMFLEHQKNNRLLALFIFIATLFILIHKLVIADKANRMKYLIVLFIYGLPLFVFYKSGFVRGMEADYFIYVSLIILVINDLHFDNFKKYSGLLILVCLSISIYFIYVMQKTPIPVKDKLDKYYFSAIKEYEPTLKLAEIPEANKLPADILQKIGKSTIDVYPWNIQMLMENKLNYSPRPVIQAYTAYTPYLEEMNFNHFNSTKAPQFVLYDYTSIDYRYPLFDESKVNLCITKNYEIASYFDYQGRKVILFEKKKDFSPIQLIKSDEYAMNANSPLIPKEGVYYEVGVYNSVIGKLYSIFNNAPEMKIEINAGDAFQREYHIGKKLLETGLFSDKYIKDTHDFHKLFNNDSLQTLMPIKSYKFKFINNNYFKDKIRITEYKITQ